MKINRLLIYFLLLFAVLSCKNLKKKKAIIRDTSITKTTSYNNLFFDSLNIVDFLQTNQEFKDFEEQYQDFYQERNYQYGWFDNKGITEQATHFLNLLTTTANDMQDSSLMNQELLGLFEKAVNDSLHKMSNDSILKTELFFTGHFFKYAAKVFKGSDIDATDLGWFIPRKKIDLTALLDSSIKSDLTKVEIYAAQNSQYKKLQSQLSLYYDLSKTKTVDSIPTQLKPLKIGAQSTDIILIKKQLANLGDYKDSNLSPVFDTTLLIAVKQFQKRMGLNLDGIIGNPLIKELNVPIAKRIQQILVNMERLRWLPPENMGKYILVNIPEYRLHVYDSGKTVMEMRVIVGKAANNTVIFSGNLKYVVFSPFWNVPTSIVRNEIVPGMARNSNYISKHHMEITGNKNGLPEVRQKPGPHNSLGLVKFLFPNNYEIYLHDTPNRDLFSQSSRSLSHGCIRISEPKKMAQYLLREDNSWNSKNIDSAMHLTKEKWVTLKKTVPVYLVYFTAWVDKSGLLNFRKDIYGHDFKMAEKLFSSN